MSITRTHKKTGNFSILDNEAPNNSELSFRARGILRHLLTKPDGWTVKTNSLVNATDKEGREAIRTAFKELIDAGYAYRAKSHDPKTGRIVWINEIFETKADRERWLQNQGISSISTIAQKTVDGSAVAGKSVVLVNTDSINTDLISTHIDQQTEEFATRTDNLESNEKEKEIEPVTKPQDIFTVQPPFDNNGWLDLNLIRPQRHQKELFSKAKAETVACFKQCLLNNLQTIEYYPEQGYIMYQCEAIALEDVYCPNSIFPLQKLRSIALKEGITQGSFNKVFWDYWQETLSLYKA